MLSCQKLFNPELLLLKSQINYFITRFNKINVYVVLFFFLQHPKRKSFLNNKKKNLRDAVQNDENRKKKDEMYEVTFFRHKCDVKQSQIKISERNLPGEEPNEVLDEVHVLVDFAIVFKYFLRKCLDKFALRLLQHLTRDPMTIFG